MDFERLVAREWLVSNGLGGYASSSVSGLNTRRYHGLLVAAMTPPNRRMVLLSRVEETVRCDGHDHYLACNEYPGTIWPTGHQLLRAFNSDPHPRWAYQGEGWTLQKELQLLRGQNTVLLSYTLLGGGNGIDLEIRPMLGLRGMHELNFQWNGKLDAKPRSRGHWHVPATRRTPELFFAHDGNFDRKSHWYLNQIYRREAEYGYSGLEDLWSPGASHVRVMPGQTVHFACSADPISLQSVVEEARRQVREPDSSPLMDLSPSAPEAANDADFAALKAATDAYLLSDRNGDPLPAVAQFHWSPPSIRMALVGFTGLYLIPGHLQKAGALLTTLAASLDGGLLPSDYTSESVDSALRGADVSLWFVNAVRQYLAYGGDEAIVRKLLPAVLSVSDCYRRGAQRSIGVDGEGLLHCGSPEIAVTWMDNKVAGIPVTPRQGRPVEINALWYNGLMSTAELCRRFDRPADADSFESSAAQTKHAFNERFWNDAAGCCHDVVGTGGVDSAIRPNQLLAISLPHPVLVPERWASTVAAVREHLLTPVGVRTLSPRDHRYLGRYRGPVTDRDRAAHNGSAYSWLLGLLVTALVRSTTSLAAQGSARAEGRKLLAPCLARLKGEGLGHLPELNDGDAPHAPGGAIASPLSVAELLRCYSEDILGRTPRLATPRTSPASQFPTTDVLFPAR